MGYIIDVDDVDIVDVLIAQEALWPIIEIVPNGFSRIKY